jgi:hypothetical protein
MKKYLSIIFVAAYVFLVAAPVATVAIPTQVSAACDDRVLGVPPWYRGLTNGDCSIKSPNDVGGISNFIWKIVLNVIEMALVVVAYIAAFFILYGGFLYITGGGNASQVEKAQKSILNAVIGLIIAMGSIAVTNFIFSLFGTATPGANGVVQMSGEDLLRNSLNLAYFTAGIIAVIVIIISGINYVISSGDSGKIIKAKNMLTYAVVGLIVILTAFIITSFVIGRFK